MHSASGAEIRCPPTTRQPCRRGGQPCTTLMKHPLPGSRRPNAAARTRPRRLFAGTAGLQSGRGQNRTMNDKTHPRGGATTFDVSALAGGAPALEAAKQYTSTSVAAEFAALQAAMRPAEAFRKQLEALDPTRGIRAALERHKVAAGASALEAAKRYTSMSVAAEFAALQAAMRPAEALGKQLEALDPTRGIRASLEKHKLADVHLSAMRAAESSALEQIRRHAEISSAAGRFAALDSALLARTKAIEEILSPSKMAAKYLEELTGSSTLELAAEQALRWTAPHKGLTGALERFKQPLGVSSARALLESMAKASEPFGVRRLLEDAAQFPDSEEAREEVTQLVHAVTEGVSKALTVQEAVDQIVQAIQATKEPLHQRLLFACLVPVLIAIVFAFINPVADFYVKRWLDGAPKQEATKQVKEAAREAVGDVRILSDFRFVSAQSLAMKNGPKARAPVVGQLRFGQTVRVLERERDFTLVVWRSEDGKVELQGWVFSRYLKRFN